MGTNHRKLEFLTLRCYALAFVCRSSPQWISIVSISSCVSGRRVFHLRFALMCPRRVYSYMQLQLCIVSIAPERIFQVKCYGILIHKHYYQKAKKVEQKSFLQ